MDSELKEILKGIKGFRDFYPEDWAEYKVIFDAMHSVSESYGYEEYEGPSIEFAKLIEHKSGQEIFSETYRLFDRENRKLVLRPEMTPSLARLVSNQHQRYPKPMRWYTIPRVFRDETPQKGRVKEHYQFNADIIGVDHPAADAEIIALATNIIRKSGLNDEEFICVINSRALLQSYIESLGISNYLDVIRVIDSRAKHLQDFIEKGTFLNLLEQKPPQLPKAKLKEYALILRSIWIKDPKISKNYAELKNIPFISAYLDKLTIIEERSVKTTLSKIKLNDEQISKLYDFISIKGKPDQVIEKLKEIEMSEKSNLAIKELEVLAKFLKLYGVDEICEYDTSIARGLDYYTGIVYEFFDTTGSVVRAIAGGGRYDQLVESFGGGLIPCTGIGMGETVLHAVLKDLGRFKEYTSKAQIYVAIVSDDVTTEASKLVTKLRSKYNVLFNPFEWKFKKQLEDAVNRNIPIMIVIGKRDLKEDKVTIQNLETKEQEVVSLDKVDDTINKILR